MAASHNDPNTNWLRISVACSSSAADAAAQRALFAAAGVLHDAAQTLANVATSEGVAEECLRAVAHVCGGDTYDEREEGNIETALREGMRAAIMHAMERWPDSDTLTSAGMFALRRLCRSDAGRSVIAAEALHRVLATMQRFASSPIVQEHACSILTNVTRLQEGGDRVAAAGGAHAVLAAMQRHVDVAAVQEHGCAALANSIMTRATAAIVTAAGGVVTVVTAMRRHADAAVVQANACLAIANMVVQKVVLSRDIVGDSDSGAMRLVIAAMARHPADASVQQWACVAITNTCCHADATESDCDAVVAMGGMSAVLTALRTHPHDARVQANACGALCGLVRHDTTHAAAAVAAGAMDSVALTLGAHCDDAHVQQAGCAALANLSQTLGMAAHAASVAAVVAAMRHHASNMDVQEQAVRALTMLACCSTDNVALVDGDCSQLLVATMQRWGHNALLQASACAALMLLAHCPRHHAAVRAAGCYEAVCAAMRQHPQHALLQHLACEALLLFTGDDMSQLAAAVDAGGMAAVAAATDVCVSARDAQVQCAALGDMAKVPTVSGASQAIAVKAIVTAMRRHPADVAVQRTACAALSNALCSAGHPARACGPGHGRSDGAQVATAFAADGGLEAVLMALRNFDSDADVQERACSALALAAAVPAVYDTPDLVDLCIAAMMRHPSVATLQSRACVLLQQLAQHGAACENAVNAVNAAMQRHADDADVQRAARAALSQLTQARAGDSGCIELVACGITTALLTGTPTLTFRKGPWPHR